MDKDYLKILLKIVSEVPKTKTDAVKHLKSIDVLMKRNASKTSR